MMQIILYLIDWLASLPPLACCYWQYLAILAAYDMLILQREARN